jgi:hypothetical protein
MIKWRAISILPVCKAVRMGKVEHQCTCPICCEHPYSNVAQEHRVINRVLSLLNEKSRRRFVGLLALQWGRGSVEQLSEITGMSRPTIRRGRAEVQKVERAGTSGRVRRSGAGRLRVEKSGLVC